MTSITFLDPVSVSSRVPERPKHPDLSDPLRVASARSRLRRADGLGEAALLSAAPQQRRPARVAAQRNVRQTRILRLYWGEKAVVVKTRVKNLLHLGIIFLNYKITFTLKCHHYISIASNVVSTFHKYFFKHVSYI